MWSGHQREGRRLGGFAVLALGAWVAAAPMATGILEPGTGVLVHLLPAVAAIIGGLCMAAGGRRIVGVGALLAADAGLWLFVAGVVDLAAPTLQWSVFLWATGAMIGLIGAYVLGLGGALLRMASAASARAANEAGGTRRPPVCHYRRRGATRRLGPYAAASRSALLRPNRR